MNARLLADISKSAIAVVVIETVITVAQVRADRNSPVRLCNCKPRFRLCAVRARNRNPNNLRRTDPTVRRDRNRASCSPFPSEASDSLGPRFSDVGESAVAVVAIQHILRPAG